jgi:hypothetical protein
MLGDAPGVDEESPDVGLVHEARYASPAAAARYLTELRGEIQRCPGAVGSSVGRGDYAWSIVDSGFAGDESVLIRLAAQTFSYHDEAPRTCCSYHYVAVARSGPILVAVTSLGWELHDGYGGAAKYWAGQALTYAKELPA